MTDSSEPQWEQGWDGHERAQLLRMARLPLSQKIQWLEEAQRTVQALDRSRTALTASSRNATLRTP